MCINACNVSLPIDLDFMPTYVMEISCTSYLSLYNYELGQLVEYMIIYLVFFNCYSWFRMVYLIISLKKYLLLISGIRYKYQYYLINCNYIYSNCYNVPIIGILTYLYKYRVYIDYVCFLIFIEFIR